MNKKSKLIEMSIGLFLLSCKNPVNPFPEEMRGKLLKVKHDEATPRRQVNQLDKTIDDRDYLEFVRVEVRYSEKLKKAYLQHIIKIKQA